MSIRKMRILMLLFLGIFSMSVLQAQENRQFNRQYYDYDRDWTLGFHGGVAWQQSEVGMYDRFGGGFGMELGRRVSGAPGSFWALDWRGRLTYSNTFGQGVVRNFDMASLNDLLPSENDYPTTPGAYFFNNYRTDMVDANIEGVLTLNRLRERTGVVMQLFGGLGLDFYNQKTDQVSDFNSNYDYTLVNDSTQSRYNTRGDLVQLRNEFFRDGTYETTEGTKLTFMPSWGFGLGYQPVEWFSFGMEHRFAYPFTDRLDGWEESNPNKDWVNDIHHFTYAYARFHFGDDDDCVRPAIRLTAPNQNPFRTNMPSVNLLAEIDHITDRNQIDVTVNNIPNYSFDYNTATDRFRMTTLLQPGNNVIRIQAINACDQDAVVITVYYDQQNNFGNPPNVMFNVPAQSRIVTQEGTYRITATVTEVQQRNGISVQLNGAAITNYNFNPRNNTVEFVANLQRGENIIRIAGSNEYGTDVENTVIDYQPTPTVAAPQVEFTSPADNPHSTYGLNFPLVARIQGVSSRERISVTQNGNPIRFAVNGDLTQVTFDAGLLIGRNEFSITAQNEAGSASDRTTIIRMEEQVTLPPQVVITRPSTAPAVTNTNQYQVTATVVNVESRNQVTFLVNGRKTNDFTLDAYAQRLSANVDLATGSNKVTIRVENEAGKASDETTIIYKPQNTLEAPKVAISQPANNSTVSENQVAFVADVTNISDKTQIRMQVNNRSYNNFDFFADKQQVKARITLSEGRNNISIAVANAAGKANDDVNVTYVPQILPPKVSITYPRTTPYSTSNRAETLTANVVNIDQKSQIQVTVDGRAVSFDYNTDRREITVRLALNEGNNAVRIQVENTAGKDDARADLVYKPSIQVQPPSVRIVVPTANPFTTNQNRVAITAEVKNIVRKDQIQLNINGNTINDFQLDVAAGRINWTQILQEGSNRLDVVVKNDAGRDATKHEFIYKAPAVVQPPQVVITSPQNGASTQTNSTKVTARVLNVSEANQIQFLVNGVASSDFTFDARQQLFNGNAGLNEGNNRIEIKAENTAGKDAATTQVTYKVDCDKPVVRLVNPSSSPIEAFRPITITAKVVGVTSSSDLGVAVNGRSTSLWSFNAATQTLTIDFTGWNTGRNGLTITATNKCGTTTLDLVVNYKPMADPIVDFSAPATNGGTTTVTTPRVNISARIQNAANKDVTMIVNGQRSLFNLRGESLSANVGLNEGVNTIEITARNAAGEDRESVTITFDKPVSPPKVAFSAPSGNTTTVNVASYNVRATVRNVTDKNNIIIIYNNQRITNFSFNANASLMAFRVNLNEGANSIQINARNEAGGDTDQRTIIYKKPVTVQPGEGQKNNDSDAQQPKPKPTPRTTIPTPVRRNPKPEVKKEAPKDVKKATPPAPAKESKPKAKPEVQKPTKPAPVKESKPAEQPKREKKDDGAPTRPVRGGDGK